MKIKVVVSVTLVLFFIVGMIQPIYAQKKEKTIKEKKGIFRDSLDHKFDISKWMTDLNGFLPMPSIITEPALGYGLNLNLVFFHPTKQSIDKTGDAKKQLSLPSMSVAGGLYTQNKTWGVYGGHYGSYRQDKLRLAIFSGWLNININYYLEDPLGKEREVKFNLTGLPVYVKIMHKIGKSKWYAGLDYLFYKNTISLVELKTPGLDSLETPIFDTLIKPYFEGLATESKLGGLGINIYRQDFDNAFTPNKGTKISFVYRRNDTWLGSDYQFNNFTLRFLGFGNWIKNWVMGLRVEGEMITGDYPFYVRPFVSLRGIPVMRYQGDYVITAETEHRVNITKRWALVGFVGLGIPTDMDEQFTLGNSKVAGGGGFRYLLARWFGMYMGIDAAVGPDNWAWYIIMGSNWLGR